MGNEHFDFKQFNIRQDQCAMKVGTDGVLLGAWFSLKTCIENCKDTEATCHILDIGTGTGLIALMAAQRSSSYNIIYNVEAIEIDAIAAHQAKENIMVSPWKDKVLVINTSLQEYADSEEAKDKQYDIIVSNPPFYNATLKPEDEARAVARHKDSLPLTEITHFAYKHLSKNGELSLIYPTNYDSEVMTSAILAGLHVIRICDVVTKKGKPCKRRMATFALKSHPQQDIERQTLYLRDEAGEYTQEYRALTEDFYL